MKKLFVFAVLTGVAVALVLWFVQENKKPQTVATRQLMSDMPARSLILLKDGKILLASHTSTDDRPYTLDVLYSPTGEWKRVEFDEDARRNISGIAYYGHNQQYEFLAVEFLKQP